MSENLEGKKVAILVANGFEQAELEEPQAALEEAGAETEIVSPSHDEVVAWAKTDFGDSFTVDVTLNDARSEDYDALLVPGGKMSPDKLRRIPQAVDFVRGFFESGKPVAAICHGPQLLIEADVVQGRRLTSFPSLETDLTNAGAEWVDEKVVTDQGLVTSRTPEDMSAFNRKMLEEFAEGIHAGQKTR